MSKSAPPSQCRILTPPSASRITSNTAPYSVVGAFWMCAGLKPPRASEINFCSVPVPVPVPL